MKKIQIMLLLTVLMLASCGKGADDVTTPAITDGTTAPAVTATVTDAPNVPTSPQIELVTRTENIASAAGSTKTFIYPKVTLSDSGELSERINLEIEAACNNLFKRSLPGAASIVNGGAEIIYKTTACNTYLHNDRYLSVEFHVTIDVFGGVTDEMPSKAYSAFNIDLSTGEVLYPEKLIIDLDKLKDAVINGLFTPDEGVVLPEADIAEALVQYRADYGIYPAVYFDADRVCVCVELAKLQGGYALFYVSDDKATEYFTDQFIN